MTDKNDDLEQDQNEINKSNKGTAKTSSNGITIADKIMVFAIIGLLIFIVIAVAAKTMGMF